MVWDLGFRVWGLGFGKECSRVLGLRFRDKGVGIKIEV